MKPLTTSVYTFSKLIEGGFLYVDKTEGIHELIRPAFGQYFLSRPRRFGKSLLVSTLKAIFQGRRELFEGLFIGGTDYDWKTYPMIHLDLGTAAARTSDQLEEALCYGVEINAKALGVDLTRAQASGRFQELIDGLKARGEKVVILVDEYDKPLLGHLGKPSAAEIQTVLKGFYSVIKATKSAQRFVLLTGVSKFSKVSIFSDLNNLTDLTMNRSAATLLGYTQDELEKNFPDHIDTLAHALGMSRAGTLAELRDWYNGYRFHPGAETMYNPVSVMKCLNEREFKNYWFETGTPTFLIDMLRRRPLNLGDLSAAEGDFSTYEPEKLAALPLLVQTGYLTIQSVNQIGRNKVFRLGFPNFEIGDSFSRWLAQGFSRVDPEDLSSALQRMAGALNASRLDEMLDTLRLFFAKIPNDITIKHEKYYQTIFFTVFKLIGAMVEAETRTNIGRIDAVIKTANDIFIFEFKLRDTAESALRQIRETRYFEPFLDDGRPITLVGVSFDQVGRNLERWLIEPA